MNKTLIMLVSLATVVINAAVLAAPQDRQLLWGDTHLHSSYSPDAYFMQNRNGTPDVAYRWAMGLPVTHPYTKARLQIETPLDFLVVSDHAEYMGVPRQLFEGNPALAATDKGREYLARAEAGADQELFYELVTAVVTNTPDPVLNDRQIRTTNWQEIIQYADRYNQPGRFTAFIGWEWSSITAGRNLHRVIMTPQDASHAGQFTPYSSFDSDKPEDLWQWLEATGKKTGTEFVAIPHNMNISVGTMFDTRDSDGNPVDAAYARTRMRWEPVVEVTQIKGDSETHPSLSPNDEFADFETYEAAINTLDDSKNAASEADYTRSALKRGLEIADKTGVNPYAVGMIGSTDSHTSLASAEEDNFQGKFAIDSTPANKTREILPGVQGNHMSAQGLAAVWAEENTRESIIAALKRREVYATTGPRISLRFFGAWSFTEQDAQLAGLATTGYSKGVPMGGELTAPGRGESPSFLIHASRDPKHANLDRIQIVKGWLENGKAQEKVFDVAWSARELGDDGKPLPVGNTVDLETASWTNTIGTPELAVVWRDPEFNPQQSAFYYVRVLQIPTPRHTLYDAVAMNRAHPQDRPATIQERAYSSPIWYKPIR